MDIRVQYHPDHVVNERWEPWDQHCPYCTEKAVWVGGGDAYALGQTYCCVTCHHAWWLQEQDWGVAQQQVVEQLGQDWDKETPA